MRPDVTLAQKIGAFIAGVPILSNLLAAFGVYSPSAAQQHALTETLQWGSTVAGLLFLSDAGLRAARNSADAKRDAAALSSGSEPPSLPPAVDEPVAEVA